jgi:hypothetical protein
MLVFSRLVQLGCVIVQVCFCYAGKIIALSGILVFILGTLVLCGMLAFIVPVQCCSDKLVLIPSTVVLCVC